MASSYYEQRARERKAGDIVSHLRASGIHSSALDTMHPQDLAGHVVAAGHEHASRETMDMVRSSMKHLEGREVKDPFEGL